MLLLLLLLLMMMLMLKIMNDGKKMSRRIHVTVWRWLIKSWKGVVNGSAPR